MNNNYCDKQTKKCDDNNFLKKNEQKQLNKLMNIINENEATETTS
jgi:hypothetical protein